MTLRLSAAAGFVSAAFLTALVPNTALAQAKKPVAATTVKAAAKPSAVVAKPAATGAKLVSSKDSLSYSIGRSIAQNMKQQGMADLNGALLSQGINDALRGQAGLMSDQQCQQMLMGYMQKESAKKNAEGQKISQQNEAIGNAFLAENKSKAGVLTTASGLQYSVETAGTGPKPTAQDQVKVHYTGRLLDGKVFDSSVERGQPATFPVTGVIQGWVEALQLMPVGSKWKLYIPANLAYGNRGAGGDIKPGSTLIFDVELLEIIGKTPEPAAATPGPEPVKPAPKAGEPIKE
jgi:FKBP-type peptidyl-prolyl cis-trans isomerase FklB